MTDSERQTRIETMRRELADLEAEEAAEVNDAIDDAVEEVTETVDDETARVDETVNETVEEAVTDAIASTSALTEDDRGWITSEIESRIAAAQAPAPTAPDVEVTAVTAEVEAAPVDATPDVAPAQSHWWYRRGRWFD
jgi:division protein CdvB (Snf7/Vps24/ESCRT-III family)